MTPRIITVAAAKGGVGKTTLAYEIAAALGGVLVDLDWDAGGATRMWGFDPLKAARAPLLDALERGPEGRPPRLKRRANQPLLVPAHPDLSASRIDADLVADCLSAWAAAVAGALRRGGHPPGRQPAHRRSDAGGRPGGRAGGAGRPRDGRARGDPRPTTPATGCCWCPRWCRRCRRAASSSASPAWPTGVWPSRLRSPSTAGSGGVSAGGARNPTQPGRAGARRGRRVPRGRRVGGGGLWLSKREST